MSITLTLGPDIEEALTEQAENRGTTPELLALDVLRKRFLTARAPESSAEAPRSLADFLEGHLGVLSSSEHVAGGARMSENGGRRFAEAMVEKRRRKRL